MAVTKASHLNRKFEDTEISTGSLMDWVLCKGILLPDMKREVKEAIERKGMHMEVRVQHEPIRSSYCCEILTLSLQSKEVCFISNWFESQNDAELDAFQSAAQSYGLLDEQGLLKSRTWCKGVLNCVLSRFKEDMPIYKTRPNNAENSNYGFFSELSVELCGDNNFPSVRGNTFSRKQDAEQDGALQALKTWKFDRLSSSSDNAIFSSDSADDKDCTFP